MSPQNSGGDWLKTGEGARAPLWPEAEAVSASSLLVVSLRTRWPLTG